MYTSYLLKIYPVHGCVQRGKQMLESLVDPATDIEPDGSRFRRRGNCGRGWSNRRRRCSTRFDFRLRPNRRRNRPRWLDWRLSFHSYVHRLGNVNLLLSLRVSNLNRGGLLNDFHYLRPGLHLYRHIRYGAIHGCRRDRRDSGWLWHRRCRNRCSRRRRRRRLSDRRSRR